jgi:hypothetical protein
VARARRARVRHAAGTQARAHDQERSGAGRRMGRGSRRARSGARPGQEWYAARPRGAAKFVQVIQ